MNKNSKTLQYLEALGCEPYKMLSTGEHGELKHWASFLSDYELMYYHCKVLKMPISTYNKASIVDYLVYMAIFEYCQELDQEKQEAIEERKKARTKAETVQKIYKAILLYFGVLVVFILVLCLACFILWR